MCYSPHWLRAAFLAEGEGIALWPPDETCRRDFRGSEKALQLGNTGTGGWKQGWCALRWEGPGTMGGAPVVTLFISLIGLLDLEGDEVGPAGVGGRSWSSWRLALHLSLHGFYFGSLCVVSLSGLVWASSLKVASALRLLSGCSEIQRQMSQENQEAAVLPFGNDNLTSKVIFSCSVQVQGKGTQTPLLHGRRVKVTC